MGNGSPDRQAVNLRFTAGNQGAAVTDPGPRFRDLLLLQLSLGSYMLTMMSERLRQTELREQHAGTGAACDELGKKRPPTPPRGPKPTCWRA